MEFVQHIYLSHSWPLIAACIFSILIVLLLFSILLYQRSIRSRDARLKRWDFIADHIIRDAIFFEEMDQFDSREEGLEISKGGEIIVSKRLKILLRNKYFRRRLMDKIVSAKHSVSGIASDNLDRLFRQLDFTFDLLIMLTSTRWYQEAMALELIGFMKLHEHSHFLYENVDNRNGLVRLESQNAILRLSGFEGLNFLTQSDHLLSEWQQIKLLNELSNLLDEDFKGINEWISSPNDSVVIFALKLIRIYHRFELFGQVLNCLTHSNHEVRFQAINVLNALPNETAVSELMAIYPAETKRNRIEILRVFQSIASETEIDFLEVQLGDHEYEIKLEAARALQVIGIKGMETLMTYDLKGGNYMSEIIAQIQEERK